MNTVYLLTGGNVGDRLNNLHQSCYWIDKLVGTVIKKSRVYETAAWGVTNQPAFLNQVLWLTSEMAAHEVLNTILEIEEKMGRKRTEKMGPRTIDIDILFYNEETIALPNLTIPHPQIANRRFVLEPMREIAPTLLHPLLNKTISELLHDCSDTLEVNLFIADDVL